MLIWHLLSHLLYRKPVKAALAAVSEHLAGMLPLHLVYSQAHETAIEVLEDMHVNLTMISL